ncbi:MAG: hypothetical protein OEX22_04900 [Cyclobacteriaceae bacterium]|nr:hypothetical protein [Cyclobacteriaceae bacterium]
MRFLLKIILIVAFSALLQTFFPWWTIAIAAFVISTVLYTKGISSFFEGFIAIFLLWCTKAYLIDLANEQILSDKIATVFSVTPIILIAITGFVGGLVAGFASLSGSTFIGMFKRTKRRNKYYSL